MPVLGGKVTFDSFSDPEDESGYSAHDFISLGFKKDATNMKLLDNTPKLSDVNPEQYKAIFVSGGQAPMYTFINDKELHKFFADYYETGKPTAAISHGTNILLETKLSDGSYLVEGKNWTRFTNSEEEYADNYAGFQIQPFRIEDRAKQMNNTNFLTGVPFGSYAIRDGNLITGQQQNSGAEAARLVIEAIEDNEAQYPTYVLVHGAWADESAWGGVRNQLAVNANVEVVNLPAHGIDLTPANQVTLDDYVSMVAKAIDKHEGKVILVGHSMAGIIISSVAEKYPEKIDKLVYVAAYMPQSGESLVSWAEKDSVSLVGPNMEFNADYSASTIKLDMLAEAVCADCPDYMKEILVKYHKEEPTSALSQPLELTEKNYGSVEKYYIFTTQDKAVGYPLQKEMVNNDGGVKKTFTIDAAHLPFVTQPSQFIEILETLR